MTYRWRIHRKRNVTEYLISLRERGEEIRKTIAGLTGGVPSDATQTAPDTYIWFAAEHWIGFVVNESDRAIYVVLIEQAEQPPTS